MRGRWGEAEDIDDKKDPSHKKSSELRSREEGDNPLFTDAMFNFVPGSAFEIGTSLAILDHPGDAGKLIDSYAKYLSHITAKVYETPLGDRKITPDLSNLEKKETLRQHFDRRLFGELRPDSDQVGRCRDLGLLANWVSDPHQGRHWLSAQLNIDSDSADYNFANMLTKVRSISVLGGMLRDLMAPCKADATHEVIEASDNSKLAASELLGKPIQILDLRMSQIRTKILHKGFNDEKTRGRTEKTPIVFGKAITSIPGVTAKTINASGVKLGFGKVFHSSAMEGDPAVIAEHDRLIGGGRQSVPRLGQDISDLYAPGLLGDSSQKLIPQAFKALGLQHAIDTHLFEHGSGLNRWQLTGTYAKQSWNNSLPAAGSQSAGTTSFFSSVNCLNEESIFGSPDALKAGLLVASFMNFGGYHSFIESFPIAQAIATNTKFETIVTAAQQDLYSHIEHTVAMNGSPSATSLVQQYALAYAATLLDIQSEAAKHTSKGVIMRDPSDESLPEPPQPDDSAPAVNSASAALPEVDAAPQSIVWKVPTVSFDRHIHKQPINALFSSGVEIEPKDLKYTILDSDKVTFRNVHELAELAIATTGYVNPATMVKMTPIDLVSFQPQRIALHQAIATVITQIQYVPKNKAEEEALEHDAIFLRIINDVIAQMKNDVDRSTPILLSERAAIQKRITALVIQREAIDATVEPAHRLRMQMDLIKDAENHPLLQAIDASSAMLSDSAVLGAHVEGYTRKQAIIDLATDKIYKELATKVMTEIAETNVRAMIADGRLNALEPPKPDERLLFLIAGGQASGKGSSYATLKYNAEKNGIGWPNVSKGGGDTFRSLLLDPSTIHPELFSQLSTPEASYISHTIVKSKLDAMATAGVAPHIFVEQLYLGQDKINLALENGGSAHVVFVSTDVEQAIERSYGRGVDTGRFENVKGILSAHCGSTTQLPGRLRENAGKDLYITIVDNNVEKGMQPDQIASIDCKSGKIVIHDEEKMLNFIKKIAINVDATCPEECYNKARLATISIDSYFGGLADYAVSFEELPDADPGEGRALR